MTVKRWIIKILYVSGPKKGKEEVRNSNIGYRPNSVCTDIFDDLYKVISCTQHPDWVRPVDEEEASTKLTRCYLQN